MGRRGRRRANVRLATAVLCTFVFGAPFAVADEVTDANQPSDVEKTLAAVRDRMARHPAPWPVEWQNEYVDTIRAAIATGQEGSQYTRRLEILQKGFGPYWKSFREDTERSLFEVHQAEIRWYVENLMNADLPGAEERQMLRHRYEELGDYAAGSLLAQFSFLDPNMVQNAKANHLAECYCRIDEPLVPIYLTPFSQMEVDQIKERWHDLRYARVDLWRQLGGATKTSTESEGTRSIQTHPDYLLTQRSLHQWQSHFETLATVPPEYFKTAVAAELEGRKQRFEATSRARTQELRLDNATLQTEYISFLLAALLETAQEDASKPTKRQAPAGPGR